MNKSFLNFIYSQKLHRLGITSSSDFFYNTKDKELYWSRDLFLGMKNFEVLYLPAYTDADLSNALPHKIINRKKTVPVSNYDLVIRKTRNGKYCIEYENQIKSSPSLVQIQGDTEVEAKAQMILFLFLRKFHKI